VTVYRDVWRVCVQNRTDARAKRRSIGSNWNDFNGIAVA
jgi:hypothetical protein